MPRDYYEVLGVSKDDLYGVVHGAAKSRRYAASKAHVAGGRIGFGLGDLLENGRHFLAADFDDFPPGTDSGAGGGRIPIYAGDDGPSVEYALITSTSPVATAFCLALTSEMTSSSRSSKCARSAFQ